MLTTFIKEKDFEKIQKIMQNNDDIQCEIIKCLGYNRYLIQSVNTTSLVETELMVYIDISNTYMVIQRMGLINQRRGTGTKILNELISIAKRLHLKYLIMESVLSHAMSKFCLKNGFFLENKEFAIYIDDFYSGNYRLNLI